MAKISAHGAHDVARARIRLTLDDGHTIDRVLVLTSDGRLLGRDASAGTYNVVGRLKADRTPDEAILRRVIERRFPSYELVELTGGRSR